MDMEEKYTGKKIFSRMDRRKNRNRKIEDIYKKVNRQEIDIEI